MKNLVRRNNVNAIVNIIRHNNIVRNIAIHNVIANIAVIVIPKINIHKFNVKKRVRLVT